MWAYLENANIAVNTEKIKTLKKKDFLRKIQYEYSEECMTYLLSCEPGDDYLHSMCISNSVTVALKYGVFLHCSHPNSNEI